MKRSLPTPAMRLLLGETCVFVPTFAEKLVRTIRQIAPRECRDGINHVPKFRFRLLDFIKRTSEGFLRPLAFNCDERDISSGACRLLHQSEVLSGRPARFG